MIQKRPRMLMQNEVRDYRQGVPGVGPLVSGQKRWRPITMADQLATVLC